jgi:DNA-directed RNA polymerase I subunit RPA2
VRATPYPPSSRTFKTEAANLAAMAVAKTKKAQQKPWTTAFDTKRRHDLFSNPPKDGTAYPTLAAAVDPHINSFNTIFAAGGQLEEALKDIGTKVFLDGNPYARPEEIGQRNRLSVRIQDVFLDKSVLPPSNKVALKNRNILPAECRERHATYRGKLRARLEWKVNNGDWREEVCDLGTVPIMLRVRSAHCPRTRTVAACANSPCDSQTGVTSRT